uniref:Uncharacterized protein n=1 Tax=Leptobrachium leishanense TaxID=445787 RepID=A0A8C5Q483_9ANUR
MPKKPTQNGGPRQQDIRISMVGGPVSVSLPPSYGSSEEEEDRAWSFGGDAGMSWLTPPSRGQGQRPLSAAARKRAQKNRKAVLAASSISPLATRESSEGDSANDHQLSAASSATSEQRPGPRQASRVSGTRAEASVPGAQLMAAQTQEKDDHLPSTKGDLRRLMDEIRDMWKPEVAAVRAEVQEVRAQVMEVQTKTAEVATEQSQLAGQVTALRSQIEILSRSVETLETRHRRRNIRVRGIPDSVLEDELQPYVTRLALQVSGLPSTTPDVVGSVYRVRRPAASAKGAPRDVVVAFRDMALKTRIMTTPGAREPVQFEGSTLTLYHDLPFLTLVARRRFRDVTAVLRRQGIRYRWGLAGSLSVTYANIAHTITDPATALNVLDQAGIPLDAATVQPG